MRVFDQFPDCEKSYFLNLEVKQVGNNDFKMDIKGFLALSYHEIVKNKLYLDAEHINSLKFQPVDLSDIELNGTVWLFNESDLEDANDIFKYGSLENIPTD